MKNRCFRKQESSFAYYGGRGITVCKRWMKFENFLADMGIKPENMSLDRIDVNGNYEPGNCRWTTPTEQSRNRRDTLSLSFNGISATLAEWGEILDIKRSTLAQRYYVYGWSVDKVLSK